MSSSLRINIVLCVVTSIFPAREYCGHDWVGAWMRPEQRPSGHQLVTQYYLGWRPRVVARPAFLEIVSTLLERAACLILVLLLCVVGIFRIFQSSAIHMIGYHFIM